MKPIEETHPSVPVVREFLGENQIKDCVIIKHVQEHTVDKAVLRRKLNEFKHTKFETKEEWWKCLYEELGLEVHDD